MPESNATFVKELVEAGELKPLYDPKATIVVRKGYYYGTPSDSKFDLENADDISRTYWRLDALQETNNRNSRAQDKVKDYLVENYDEIGEEHATEIANILGIDLSKEVQVEFIVTIKATVSMPVNEDVSDLSVYDFDITLESNESKYEVQEFDADIDSIDERY
jgi:predicted ATP-grasp superfamily ATP-dependent carboligase